MSLDTDANLEVASPHNMSLTRSYTRLRRYYQRNAAAVWFRRPLAICTDVPLISFTFDDFPRSALVTGGSILNRYSLAGTYYTSLGLQGKNEPSGPMFVAEDLWALVEQRHELGCHTFSHCHSWDTAGTTFEDSIIRNALALRELLPGATFKSFSYPISAPRPLTKLKTAKFFQSCRGGGQTLNAGTADLNQLAAYFLERSQRGMQGVKAQIDMNREARGWLIFATHDVARHSSPYGCTPDFFEEVVQYALSSGARILPVAGALDSLRVSAAM